MGLGISDRKLKRGIGKDWLALLEKVRGAEAL